jgi:hypothetical protein
MQLVIATDCGTGGTGVDSQRSTTMFAIIP